MERYLKTIKLASAGAVLIFLVSLGFALGTLHSSMEQVQRKLHESVEWYASEINHDALSFLNAVNRFVLGAGETDRDDVLIKLEVLSSRLAGLRHGVFKALITSANEEGMADIERRLSDLERYRGMLTAIERGDFDRARAFVGEFTVFISEVRQLSLQILHAAQKSRSKDFRRTIDLLTNTQFFIGGLVLCGVLLIILLVVQTRRLISLQKGLEQEVETRTWDLRNEIRMHQRTHTALVAAKARAETANHTKTAFLASMSHELRTPLNAIIGFSEMMVLRVYGELGSEKYKEYAANIKESANHLLSLISDILDITKIESDKFEIFEEDVDVVENINWCIGILGPKSAEKKQSLGLTVETDFPSLWADSRAVKQCVMNLISNAQKFTPDGGRIAVDAKLDSKGAIVVSVSDTGIGIPSDQIDDVLKPFFRCEDEMRRRFEGAGLGLAIVASLMKMHGGSLAVESNQGVGTTATLVFPASRTCSPVQESAVTCLSA